MVTTLKSAHPIARKEHCCGFCQGKIEVGQEYFRQTNVYDGIVYDFITHTECKAVAFELDMYNDCDDGGLDGEQFREQIDEYVYDNHYDNEADDIHADWNLPCYEVVKKILNELNE